MRGRLARAAVAVLSAAATSFLFGWIFVSGTAGTPDLAYVGLCGLLTGLLGATVVVLSTPFPRAEAVALTLWMGTCSGLLMGPAPGLLAGCAFALYFALRPIRSPAGAGFELGTCLALAFIVGPRVLDRLDLGVSAWLSPAWRDTLLLLLLVGAVRTYERMQRHLPRLPSPTAACLLALVSTAPALYISAADDPWRQGPQLPPAAPRSASPERPNVILLILDTVRADRLSIYGFERDTTPRLRRFLERTPNAALVKRAVAPATWTIPSHSSLFTGLMPSRHGLHAGSIFVEGSVRTPRLKADETLAETLKRQGYRTGFVYSNKFLGLMQDLGRGFEWYVTPDTPLPMPLVGEAIRSRWLPRVYAGEATRPPRASYINRGVLRFVDACGDAPCFVVANYMDTHIPYEPRSPFKGRFVEDRVLGHRGPPSMNLPEAERRWLDGRYQEEILELDEQLGLLLRALEQRGTLADSWLIITADHGEGFGEHGMTDHGTNVYAETVWIPLIIKPPGHVRIDPPETVSLLDVATTVASIAGVPSFGSGQDLSRRGDDLEGPARVEFFGDARKAEQHGALAAVPGRAVQRRGWKLIEQGDLVALYDVRSDPSERTDLSRSRPDIVAGLAPLLPDQELASGDETSRSVSREDERLLRALGYVE